LMRHNSSHAANTAPILRHSFFTLPLTAAVNWQP
jgi:hypothetical protein